MSGTTANSSGRQTIVFAGGGTGGHLFPGIAVAEALKARGVTAHVVFIGSTRAVERHIVERNGFEHIALPVESSAPSGAARCDLPIACGSRPALRGICCRSAGRRSSLDLADSRAFRSCGPPDRAGFR